MSTRYIAGGGISRPAIFMLVFAMLGACHQRREDLPLQNEVGSQVENLVCQAFRLRLRENGAVKVSALTEMSLLFRIDRKELRQMTERRGFRNVCERNPRCTVFLAGGHLGFSDNSVTGYRNWLDIDRTTGTYRMVRSGPDFWFEYSGTCKRVDDTTLWLAVDEFRRKSSEARN